MYFTADYLCLSVISVIPKSFVNDYNFYNDLGYSIQAVDSIKGVDSTMGKKNLSITPSEQLVMRILWESAEPLRASEVTARLADTTAWRLTTVRTFLSRLEKKGAVQVQSNENGITVYRPALLEEELRFLEEETVINKYFDGTLSGLMNRFIEAGRVSEEELRTIRQMIDEKLKNTNK